MRQLIKSDEMKLLRNISKKKLKMIKPGMNKYMPTMTKMAFIHCYKIDINVNIWKNQGEEKPVI